MPVVLMTAVKRSAATKLKSKWHKKWYITGEGKEAADNLD